MSYATTNPPQLVHRFAGSLGLWMYASTDIHTDVDAADYFSNGHALGMKVNDVVLVVKTSATKGITAHMVSTVTSGGAATVEPAILA